MLKKLLIVTVSLVLMHCLCACSNTEIKNEDAVTYATAQELAEKFMEVSAKGDIEQMHKLYYDDMLAKYHETISDKVSRKEFDALISQEMKTLVGYELYMYGRPELMSSAPAIYYVNYFYKMSTGMETELNSKMVTDCANMRVYTPMSKSDHMLAKINGSWYVIY